MRNDERGRRKGRRENRGRRNGERGRWKGRREKRGSALFSSTVNREL